MFSAKHWCGSMVFRESEDCVEVSDIVVYGGFEEGIEALRRQRLETRVRG